MHERLASYLPEWEDPYWEETPSVSLAALRRRFPTFDPRSASAEAWEEKLEHYLLEVRLNEDLIFDRSQVRLDSDEAAQLSWKGVHFICPLSQARVRELFIVEGRALSRSAVRIPHVRKLLHNIVLRQHLLSLLRDGGRGLPSGDRRLLADELTRICDPGDAAANRALLATEAALAQLAAATAARAGREERRRKRLRRRKREAALQRKKLEADALGLWAALRRAEAAPPPNSAPPQRA